VNRQLMITPRPFTYSELEALSPELEASGPSAGVGRNSPDYIRWVQQSLNQIMGLRLAVDGIMGPATRSAIRSFQQKRGLIADGIVGPKTEAAMRAGLSGILIPPRTKPPYTTPPLLTLPTDESVHRTVYGWGKYRRNVNELPRDQQAVLKGIGDMIVASYQSGGQPVRQVQVYGHADQDTPRNLQREQQMSDERAQQVTSWLKAYVGGSLAAQIMWDTRGFGATLLKAPSTTEENRRQNRRVETLLVAQKRVLPCCPCPPTESRDFTAWLQRSLNQLLGLRLPVNGVFDTKTQGALRSFQTAAALTPTGTLDHRTYQTMQFGGASKPPCAVVQSKLSLYQEPIKNKTITALEQKEYDNFKGCAEFLGRRICAFGGATSFSTGMEILRAIESASNSAGKVTEVHIFSHSRPVGISGSWRGYDSGWYVDHKVQTPTDRAFGARLTNDLDSTWLAPDVVFYLHGCRTAVDCPTGDGFAKNLLSVLVGHGLHGAKVFAHQGAKGAGKNEDWIKFYRDNTGLIKEERLGTLSNGPFCPG
jgi:peptidoglycan hydrolase-like protein with peptidoglycan-binding domain